MKILAHLDPHVLEREVLLRVDQAHPTDRPGRTLILVPTVRLVDHLQHRLAGRRRAWLGLEVVTPSALARRILAGSARDVEPALPARLLDAFARRILRRLPDNAWTRYIGQRPGALPRIRSALSDLREAGLSPAEVTRAAARGTQNDRALAEIYADYCGALETPHASPRKDEASVIRGALEDAAAYGRAHGHVFVHGAYEWIGMHLDLIRALASETKLTVFLPAQPDARVAGYASDYARDFLPGRVETLGDPLPIEQRFDLSALYDEEAQPRPAAVERTVFRHCQGEAAEVKIAVREALAAVRDGCPPSEIVITARSLEPYAAALEQAFEDENLPWTSSLPSPLRRHPLVRDFLLMLEIVAQDFPRRATAEWLRSPRVRFKSLLPEALAAGGRADVWSRKARIIGGLAEWTRDLPRWAEEVWFHPDHDDDARKDALLAAEKRATAARRIGRTLEALRDRLDPRPRTWSDHATILRDLLQSIFAEPARCRTGENDAVNDAAVATTEALETLLNETALQETLVGDDRRVPFAELQAWFVDAVDTTELPLYRRDQGGIRVLDAMQLRGLTFNRVFLLGLNSGLFPRPAREDPILGDAFRARLRKTTRRPLPVKATGGAEERLLLAGILGAAEERVEVSWQRADESGKSRTPSLALREIARVAYGRPDLDHLRRNARHLRSHPTQWLEDLVEEPGLLAPDEELLLLALGAVIPGAAAGLAAGFPEIAPGLRLLRATQAFEVVDARYDGRVGPRRQAGPLSVTAFETLGRCPLQFFFNRILGIRELDLQADALEIEPRELGTRIHDVLDRVYCTLLEEELLGPETVDAALGRAEELLNEARPDLLGTSGPRLARRVPVLFDHMSRRLTCALLGFMRADLPFWAHGGYRPGAFETEVLRTIDFGSGVEVTLRGRLDRTLTRDGTTLVGDYKTSGNLERRVKPANMLRGDTLQVPLYRLLAGQRSRVELLGVGPDFEGDIDSDSTYRHVFVDFAEDTHKEGFRETARTLLDLRRVGRYPFHAGPHCNWCAFTQGCRRQHPPSQDREERSLDSRDFRRTKQKTLKRATLETLAGPDASPDRP